MRINAESAPPTFQPMYEVPKLLPDTEEPMVIRTPLEAAANPVIIEDEDEEEEDDLLQQPTCYRQGGCNMPCRAAGFCMGVGEDSLLSLIECF